MHQITADEFSMLQVVLTFGLTGLLSYGGKNNRIIRNRKDPAVGDGNPVGIAPEVFNGIAKAVKGLLDVGAPVCFIKSVFPFFPVISVRIRKLLEDFRIFPSMVSPPLETMQWICTW